MSCESLTIHLLSQHQTENHSVLANIYDLGDSDVKNIQLLDDNCTQCRDTWAHHSYPFSGKVFECALCKKIFSAKKHLEFHIQIEHASSNVKYYACRVCYKTLYKREQDMVKHMEKFHFASLMDVSQLVVNTVEDVTFSCEICGQKCVMIKCCAKRKKRRTSLVQMYESNKCTEHLISHKCEVCKTMFEDCEKLWSHMFLCHPENEVFQCNICANSSDDVNTFRYAPVFMYHMKMEHKVQLFLSQQICKLRKVTKISVDGVVKFKCLECPLMQTRFNALKKHLFVHSNVSIEKPPVDQVYVCELCKKRFPSKRNLSLHHMAVHEKVRPHKCNVCGRAFADKTNLNSHVRIHTGERKFVCELCGAAFVQSASLRYHMYTHSDKRLVCSQCGKTFKNPNNLRSHMNIHTGKRIYVCEVCGKEFRVREIWKGHMAVHSTARPFICEICSAGYKTRKNLVQHYKTHMKARA